MKGAIMTSGGGGIGKLFAAIGVTYPAGSTVTCTNGSKTLKAKTTSGQWVFAIPEAGTWTVTATDGTSTNSQSVSITSEGQSVNVALQYDFVIFANGAYGPLVTMENMSIKNGRLLMTKTSAGSDAITSHSSAKIDLTEYSKLRLVGAYSNDASSHSEYRQATVGVASGHVANEQYNQGDFAAYKMFEGVKSYTADIEIDISSFSGEYYVVMSMDTYNGTFNWYVDELKLLR